MADGVWGGRQPSMYPPSSGMMKRPRNEYDLPPSRMAPGPDMHDYASQDNQAGHRLAKDSESIGSAYDRYLQSTQNASYSQGEANTFSRPPMGGGPSMGEPSLLGRPGPGAQEGVMNGRGVSFGVQQLPVDTMPRPVRETARLPFDASNTLYVEGLPSNITKREVAHIFRPFVGYREVRLVIKDAKHRSGDPIILCFVDFVDAACAATAMSALQGYKVDEDDRDSAHLRIQFSRNPGPRSGSGLHGRR